MKLLITGIVALITLAVGFWGCNDLSRTTYSGSDYVMFSDTLSMCRTARNGLKFR